MAAVENHVSHKIRPERRLSSQRSHFTVFGAHPNGLAELPAFKKDDHLLESIVIPAGAVNDVRAELELSGISEATIFPDLEGLSRELNDVWLSHFGPTTTPRLEN